MNVPAFEYLRAASLEEACTLLSACGKQGKIIAGGTDILVKMKHRRLIPPCLIDIKRIPGLDYIRYEDGKGLLVGPLASIESIKHSLVARKKYPVLHQAAAYMATVAIRNQATLAGNICNGSPSAETAPALIVLDAEVRIVGRGGERIVPVEAFFTGPGSTVLEPDEVVAELRIPEPPLGGGAYEKHSLRRMDVAMVGVAALIVPEGEACGDVRIVLSAVAPTPIRAKKAESILRGQVPMEALIEEAARAAAEESRPITDLRGSAQSRRNIVETLTNQVIHQALRAAKLGVR
ncbi:MAG: xanthine dehydrogenase family protein subunit M [bacterium]